MKTPRLDEPDEDDNQVNQMKVCKFLKLYWAFFQEGERTTSYPQKHANNLHLSTHNLRRWSEYPYFYPLSMRPTVTKHQ
jgi:hypothetical protein